MNTVKECGCEPTGWIMYAWDLSNDGQLDHILDSARDNYVASLDRGNNVYVFIAEDGTLQPWLKSFGVELGNKIGDKITELRTMESTRIS